MRPNLYPLGMKSEGSENKDFMQIEQAAICCGVSLPTIRQWIEKMKMRTVFLSEGPAVSIEDLRKYMLGQRLSIPKELDWRLRVMVVEDEPAMARVETKILRGLWPDANILSVRDGHHAAAELPAFQPDLLVLDLGLPGISGIELCRKIRDWPELTHTKVLVVTGSNDWETNNRTLESGADEYLTKPFTPRELCQSAIRLLM